MPALSDDSTNVFRSSSVQRKTAKQQPDDLPEHDIDIFSALADIGSTSVQRQTDSDDNISPENPPTRRAKPNSPEANLLRALDMDTDTPIVGEWQSSSATSGLSRSMPSPQVQRAINIEEISTEVGSPQTTENGAVDETTIDTLAHKVFRILRDRLRHERERRDLK
jgi:hypothetical protein